MAPGALGPDSPSKRKRGPERSRQNDGNEAKKRKKREQKANKKRLGRANEKRTKNATKRAQKAREEAKAHHAPGGASQIADNENL